MLLGAMPSLACVRGDEIRPDCIRPDCNGARVKVAECRRQVYVCRCTVTRRVANKLTVGHCITLNNSRCLVHAGYHQTCRMIRTADPVCHMQVCLPCRRCTTRLSTCPSCSACCGAVAVSGFRVVTDHSYIHDSGTLLCCSEALSAPALVRLRTRTSTMHGAL